MKKNNRLITIQKEIKQSKSSVFCKSNKFKNLLKNLLKKEQIKDYITGEINGIKTKIEDLKSRGYIVIIICMTGDIIHPGHINYIKTAKEKIRQKFNLHTKKIKIIIGLEDERRTVKRKGKYPIFSNDERRYQWKHIKDIEDVFVRNLDINLYPSDLMLYLQPDYRVSHEEYFNFERYLRVSRKLKYGTDGKTKAVIVKFSDPDKYLPEGDVRKKWGLSTTNIVKRIVKKQKNLLFRIINERESS